MGRKGAARQGKARQGKARQGRARTDSSSIRANYLHINTCSSGGIISFFVQGYEEEFSISFIDARIEMGVGLAFVSEMRWRESCFSS
jgi:hypothetical protein